MQRVAAFLTDAAALVLLDLVIARMRNRALESGEPARVAKHPWLMAFVVEIAAQMGDSLVFQRRRAAAAIDRAVAVQHLPPSPTMAAHAVPASAVPDARPGTPLPAPRTVSHGTPSPKAAGTPEA